VGAAELAAQKALHASPSLEVGRKGRDCSTLSQRSPKRLTMNESPAGGNGAAPPRRSRGVSARDGRALRIPSSTSLAISSSASWGRRVRETAACGRSDDREGAGPRSHYATDAQQQRAKCSQNVATSRRQALEPPGRRRTTKVERGAGFPLLERKTGTRRREEECARRESNPRPSA
jgi:hypothetical protein